MIRNEAVTVLRLDNTQHNQAAAQAAAAIGKVGATGEASAGQIRAAMRSLPAQFTDVATSLAGGQNPMLVLLQQGGQVRDQFGSIGAALRGVATSVGPLGLVAAAIGTAAVAAVQGYRESVALAKALALNGNAAGVTAGQIDELAKSLAQASTAGVGVFRTALGDLAGSGAFLGDNLALAGRATVALQKLSGQSSEQITRDLAGMRDGVAGWAMAHNRSFNFITAQQYRYIVALEAQGKGQEAAKVALEAFVQAVESRTVPALGTVERLLDKGAKLWNEFWDASKGGTPDTADDKLQALQRRLEGLQRLGPGDKFYDAAGTRVPDRAAAESSIRARMEALRQEIGASRAAAQADAERAANEQREIKQAQEQFVSAQLAVDAAAEAKRLAIAVAGSNAWRAAIEQRYEQLGMSGRAYYEEVTTLERQRADAEVQSAARAVDRERNRAAGNPQEVLARTQAIIQAETRLIEVRGRRAQLEVDIQRGKFDPKARNVAETPQAAFRQSELSSGEAVNSALLDLAARRQADQQRMLSELVRANEDANLQLIQDDEQRAQAQITLERRRLQAQIDAIYGSSPAKAEAEAAADAAVQAKRQATAQKFARDTALVTREETRDALAAAFRDTKNPLQAFGAALGNIVFQRVSTSVAEALLSSAFGPGGGFTGGLIGGLFSGFGSPAGLLAGATGFGDYNLVADLAGQRAGGGNVDAGRAYLVGENGPEVLRMGNQGGSIVPNHALGGGTHVTVVQHNTFGAGVSPGQLAPLLLQTKEATKAEVMQQLSRERIA